jgi:hypothetical protein
MKAHVCTQKNSTEVNTRLRDAQRSEQNWVQKGFSLFLDLWDIYNKDAFVYSCINYAVFKDMHNAAIYKYVLRFWPDI